MDTEDDTYEVKGKNVAASGHFSKLDFENLNDEVL